MVRVLLQEAEKRLDDSSREISRLKSELGRCQSLLSNFIGETESLRTRVEREKREAGEEVGDFIVTFLMQVG